MSLGDGSDGGGCFGACASCGGVVVNAVVIKVHGYGACCVMLVFIMMVKDGDWYGNGDGSVVIVIIVHLLVAMVKRW